MPYQAMKPHLVKLDPERAEALKAYAKSRGWTFQWVMNKAIQEYLNKRTPADLATG